MKAIIKFDGYTQEIKRKSIIEIELKGKEGKEILSICGKIRGHSDEIAKYNENPLFKEIHRLWKAYHLNDMHAGTEAQEKAIEKWKKQGNKYNYTEVCDYLKSIGLYDDNGYRYGTSWLYRPIPENDLNIIKAIIRIYSNN